MIQDSNKFLKNTEKYRKNICINTWNSKDRDSLSEINITTIHNKSKNYGNTIQPSTTDSTTLHDTQRNQNKILNITKNSTGQKIPFLDYWVSKQRDYGMHGCSWRKRNELSALIIEIILYHPIYFVKDRLCWHWRLLPQIWNHQDHLSTRVACLASRLQQKGFIDLRSMSLLRSREVKFSGNSLGMGVRILILNLSLYPESPLDGGVPMVFDGIIGPPGQKFSNHSPLIAISKSVISYCLWAWIMTSSSSSVHRSLLISGLRWLCHLSLHCLPILPGNCLAM